MLVLAVVGVTALEGCSAAQQQAALTVGAAEVLVAPERATTATATPEDRTVQDTRLVRELVSRQAQALVLVDTADGDFTDDRVAALADEVRTTAPTETAELVAWLEEHGQDVPAEAADPERLDHDALSDLPGTVSSAQLDDLARAWDSDVDRLFLGLLISLEEGAVATVDGAMADGTDPQVRELGARTSATSEQRVARMRDLLADLT